MLARCHVAEATNNCNAISSMRFAKGIINWKSLRPPAMHWEDMRFFPRLGAAHFRRTQEKTSIAKYSRKRAYLIEKNAAEG